MLTTILGYPRIGARRELKRALERFWSGRATEAELEAEAARIRRENWLTARSAGLDVVPVNDFSLYDHVLDACRAFGVVPERFGADRGLGAYFLMARGRAPGVERATQPLEMTKWFDTNYHYLVPEVDARTRFVYERGQAAAHFLEARALGLAARPVLLGPVTFLLSAKDALRRPASLDRLDELAGAYAAALADLGALGADWIELDEPSFVLDLPTEVRRAAERAYAKLAASGPRLLVATYFGALGENLEWVAELPVAGLHVDALAGRRELPRLNARLPADRLLSLGLVDGRNVWRGDLARALEIAETVLEARAPERVAIAPTCSLLHVPVDLELEAGLDPELRGWLAFARQKLDEVEIVRRALRDGRETVADALASARGAAAARRASPRVHRPEVRARLATVRDEDTLRSVSGPLRRSRQRAALGLPLLPTTTIGSFPQTEDVRRLRAARRSGELGEAEYVSALRRVIDETVLAQEQIGLDVLVHGEPERSDMVEYFGELLDGMAVTENGWVQSYGSRCVKPPIVFGDVTRARPLTVEWAKYAQSRTARPMKGMLTGPITLAKWSFVRDDEPLEHTCRTLALALRDEIADLERAGIRVIQVDEPAFREALPLRARARAEYLAWAVRCFRLATAGVLPETQIHTHMCYSEFGDVIDAIAALDADVISIESARSAMDLVDHFARHRYPNEIGLGVYDIHSPRVPETAEMKALLDRALAVLDLEQVWVNPDCGLKTRRWEEVVPALEHMVSAARAARVRGTGVPPSAEDRPADRTPEQ